MYDFAPRLVKTLTRVYNPILSLFRRHGVTPDQLSWFALVASLGAAAAVANGRLAFGLWLMVLGQLLDGLDGAMARRYDLISPTGQRLDTVLDRVSETALFLGFALGGFVSWILALLAIAAVLLLTTIVDRSGLDPGLKRFALYFGLWVPYPLIFTVIFGVNLAAYAVQLSQLHPKLKKGAQQLMQPANAQTKPEDAAKPVTKLVPPPDPMEALLLATFPVSNADFETLAANRAQAVQTYLLQTGKVDAGRLFLKAGGAEILRPDGSRAYLQFQ